MDVDLDSSSTLPTQPTHDQVLSTYRQKTQALDREIEAAEDRLAHLELLSQIPQSTEEPWKSCRILSSKDSTIEQQSDAWLSLQCHRFSDRHIKPRWDLQMPSTPQVQTTLMNDSAFQKRSLERWYRQVCKSQHDLDIHGRLLAAFAARMGFDWSTIFPHWFQQARELCTGIPSIYSFETIQLLLIHTRSFVEDAAAENSRVYPETHVIVRPMLSKDVVSEETLDEWFQSAGNDCYHKSDKVTWCCDSSIFLEPGITQLSTPSDWITICIDTYRIVVYDYNKVSGVSLEIEIVKQRLEPIVKHLFPLLRTLEYATTETSIERLRTCHIETLYRLDDSDRTSQIRASGPLAIHTIRTLSSSSGLDNSQLWATLSDDPITNETITALARLHLNMLLDSRLRTWDAWEKGRAAQLVPVKSIRQAGRAKEPNNLEAEMSTSLITDDQSSMIQDTEEDDIVILVLSPSP